MNWQQIPQELRDLPQWVNWRFEERGGKRTKVPHVAGSRRQASSTDPATWATFESALAAMSQCDGIGFVFTGDDDLVGVDLDGCRDPETGAIEEWAQEIIHLLNSYTEVTPSGRGLHVICRGKLPPGRRKKGPIEVYEHGRYFTVTGNLLNGGPDDAEERTRELAQFHAAVFAEPVAPTNGARPASPATATETEIIDKVRHKPKYNALWLGDWQREGYPSQSEADLALCSEIAYFAGPDTAAIDGVFRQSQLFREKWDSPHHGRAGSTYGRDTVSEALAGKVKFYGWNRNGNQNGNGRVFEDKEAPTAKAGNGNINDVIGTYGPSKMADLTEERPANPADAIWKPGTMTDRANGVSITTSR